jgi:anion-transporting  ArsA/GET3 family ATPase
MRIQVFVGTGGVGKTSVAAASALGAAVSGGKMLVLTIDPALRLRTALGLDPGGIQQKVPLESGVAGELWAGLMSIRATLDRAVQLYGEPKQAETILGHPVYRMLIDSLAGMQELLAIERIDQALSEGFDGLFIDTAPSRHAFEFLDKPEFFAQLVSFPLVQMVGRTYRWWEKSTFSRLGRKSVELYTRVEEILGSNMVRQVLDFYSVFRTIAEGYAARARRTHALLQDPGITQFTVVTTPFKARRDADYFLNELNKRRFPVARLIVNRIWPDFHRLLPREAPSAARELFDWYDQVSVSHQELCRQVSSEYAGKAQSVVGLPELRRDVDGLPALRQIAANLATAASAAST